MSQRGVSHQNLHNHEARKVEKSRHTTKQLLDYIVAAQAKVPFRRRFSWIVTTCHTIESRATYSGYHDNIDEEIYKLFYNICLKCKSWAEASIVQAHLHVADEIRTIQADIETLCRKIGISHQRRSIQECEHDNEKDRECLMQKTREILPHREFRDACLALENSDAEEMMHVMQSILSESAPDHPCRNEAFKLLYSLSKRCQKFVTIPIVRIEENGDLVESGGFGSIWRTVYNGSEVALKALTFYSEQDNSKTEKMLRREILLWNLITQQRHPHILPLIGITESRFPLVKMVAPWQENGNLLRYVNQSRPTIINRLKLLVQVCSALRYLHKHVPVVIHADLKCANVLVDRNGSPCLADFGLATVRHNGATLTSVLEGGSTRWMAPELFANPNSEDSDDDMPPLKVTRYSDIWSFGMLILELLTGNIPFADKVLNTAVIYALMRGERPRRPLESEVIARGLNDELWKCLCRCWDLKPERRLQLDIIQEVLEKLATQWHPMSSSAQGKMERNITESMSVPVSVCSHIIGACGRNIRQYESIYGVKIKLTDQGGLVRCEITGFPENVGEARATIEQLTEAQVKRSQKSIFVPKHLHGYLIGRDGTRIRDFQSKYHVRVSFDSALNQAIVQGAEENVNEAVNELCQTVELDKEWAPSLKLTIAKRAARRLRIEKDSIIETTRLDALTIRDLDSSDEHQIVVLRATNAEILDKAKATVDQICHDVQAESELVLHVPLDLRGLILGPQWKTWTEIVLRCGGPEDPRLQSELIEMDRTSERVILRGHADLINALEREIQIVLRTQKRDVYSMLISTRYHNDLRRSIAALQQATGTLILLPGDKAYEDFKDPIILNRRSGVDSASIVKIVGTQDGYKQACIDLNAKVLNIESTQAIFQIPLKYENVIYGQIRRRLADIDVRISPSIDIHDEYPTGRPTNDQDWQVIKRYHGSSSSTQEWTLRAATKESLVLARDMIKDAYKKAKHAKYIGFLAFPDKTKFGRIVGKNGETVQRLQAETNTTIRVPKNTEEDHIIQITGSAQDIEIAKTRIEDLVNNDPPSPTDRLFKPSRTLFSQTN